MITLKNILIIIVIIIILICVYKIVNLSQSDSSNSDNLKSDNLDDPDNDNDISMPEKEHNNEWLESLGYGKVKQVYFEDPIGSRNLLPCDDKWWENHYKTVDHDPDNLVESHMEAFKGKNRFAKLVYVFEDGTQMEPTKEFFELEAATFRDN